MSEIEKMYENAGINATAKTKEVRHNLFECGLFYPEFTPNKQIELIKWLGRNKNGFGFFNDGTKILSCHCHFGWECFDNDFYAEDFGNALAGLINQLWQDLTEEEKEQIREILK